MSFFKEFKAFAMRGNVVDLAVAVVIGTAFGKITSSLVDGIIMPVIGLIIGGIDISSKVITFGNATIKWGMFLQSVIDFTIIAFALFCLVKAINSLHKGKGKSANLTEVQLLTQIRDILKHEQKPSK